MRLISVTRANDGNKVFVNVDKVCAIYPHHEREDATVIRFAGSYTYVVVSESPNEIVNMIQEGEG